MSKHDQLKMTEDRHKYFGTPGNLETLVDEICEESGLDYIMVVKLIPLWLLMLTRKQRTIAQLYYLKRMSIVEIRYQIGANSNSDVDKCLQAAKRKIIKVSKEDQD